MEILNGKQLDETQFEAAKRSLVSEMISSQASVKATALAALLSTIRATDPDFTL
jgi:hypothetical protein